MPVPQIMAAVGMKGLLSLQRVVSDNLANASTSGFKKMLVAFRADAAGQPQPQGRLDLSQGALETTGNPLDLALEGPGFFVVRTAQGDRLTRGGSFLVNAQGQIATRDGALLLGQGGAPVTVGSDVHVAQDGTVTSKGTVVGRLQRVDVDAAHLVQEGPYLRATAPTTPATPAVHGGAVEQSNVQPVGEMVQMMQTLRSFELMQQVVRAQDDMQQRLTTDVARVR